MSTATLSSLKAKFKRQSIRHKVIHEALYTFDFIKKFKCDILDICHDGCLFRILQVMQEGDIFHIMLENKKHNCIIIKCRVVHVSGHRVGVKFFKNSDNEYFMKDFMKEISDTKTGLKYD